ncbi:hypothetical protein VT84_14750 [Gemmata sp. SH-PL17]|uniref:tetratricopeptide repeat protein n=1 Tax=Gemmata sp. SH-PL17 TaxID=1630693 RepID=UPI00078C1D2A|nr:hypothetical protein [Gemmata sp. SH-PL17]AMV25654.1 hypothetical protein VT84_14750 [Gemmata sp. SH-PL17]
MSDPVPLPAPLPPPKPTRRTPWGYWADAVLAFAVLAFAFLAGSFVARNSDVWLHLATGRLVSQGAYHFGTDPFAYTTADKYWANHAWLFDLGLYLAFKWFGGAGLVVLKALAVAGTAGAMWVTARGRGAVWPIASCLLLAVLACGPRLLLQPTIASLLLLAVGLCCLRAGGRALVAIPVLTAVWVNLDAWFFLAPALVVLFWLGRRIDPQRATLPAWPNWLVPATFGACLLSPHHVFALRLPLELSPAVWSSEFVSDPRFAGVFVSPWHASTLGAAGGYNLAAWAFFVLLALGIVSFAANRTAVLSWRVMVWVPFALLAAWQARLIPFFAVVAGPITALNLREVISETSLPRFGRGFALIGSSALLVLAWFGWTTGFSNRDRAPAWAVHTDPTLARAAEGTSAARQQSGFTPDRVLATHPDAGHYLAWFAPGERYFLDSRLHLFTHVAGDFAAASRAVRLLGEPGPGDARQLDDFGAVLLYDPDGGRMTRALRATTGTDSTWALARVDGGAVLLARSATSSRRFDPEREAFNGSPAPLPVAGTGPATLAEPELAWWIATRTVGRSGSWEADAATIYLRMFESGSSREPALPLLAVRTARAGAEVDPNDPIAWLALGRAYGTLGERTWERETGTGLTPLEHVRQVQIITALVQSVLLNPGSVPARESLAGALLRRNMLDSARPHASEALRLVRRAGPGPGEASEAFTERVGRLNALVDQLEAGIQDGENRYLIRTMGLAGDPLARARIALELGLSQKAIDVLRTSHPDLYGGAGLGLLADLLLQSGQAAECRVLLDRAELRRNPDVLGIATLPRAADPNGYNWAYQLPTYDWLDLCQCAAVGRYPGATEAVDRICARLDAEEQSQAQSVATSGAALFVLEIGMGAPPIPVHARLSRARDRARFTEVLVQVKSLSTARADLTTLAGVLELERGATSAALSRFKSAQTLYTPTKSMGLAAPGAPLASRYYEVLNKYR